MRSWTTCMWCARRESVLLAQPSASSSVGLRPPGEEPPGFQHLTVEARLADPTVVVWKGGEDIFGTPLGHLEYVVVQLQPTTESHRTLLERIPALTDLQSAWLLLLFCGTLRANHSLRVVHPCLIESFARQHDAGVWQCLCTLLDQVPDDMQRESALEHGRTGPSQRDPRKDCRVLGRHPIMPEELIDLRGRFCSTGVLIAWRGVAKVVARRLSSVAVLKRSSFWSAVHQFPCVFPLEILVAGISGPLFASL